MKLLNAHRPDIKTKDLIRLYKKGLSATQIAQQLGLFKSSVSRRLKKAGILLRSSTDYSADKRYWLWKGTNYIDPITRKRNQRKHRQWSKAVQSRDKYTCTQCGKTEVYLHAHHIVPFKECFNTPLAFDINNGITVCVPCHKKLEKK